MAVTRQVTFDAIERLGQARTLGDILNCISATSDHFGHQNVSIAGIPLPNEKIDDHVLSCGWPVEWSNRYKELDYVKFDPVIRKTLGSAEPFAWCEAKPPRGDAMAIRVMDEARDFGLCEGFAVPIYTTHGFQAIVTFGAEEMRLNAEQRAGLHMIAIYAHAAARSVLPDGGRREGNTVGQPSLSKREIECLQWTAAGKTSWEISVVLGLSQSTVDFYLRNAANKLDAVNRTQAVAMALRSHMIQ